MATAPAAASVVAAIWVRRECGGKGLCEAVRTSHHQGGGVGYELPGELRAHARVCVSQGRCQALANAQRRKRRRGGRDRAGAGPSPGTGHRQAVPAQRRLLLPGLLPAVGPGRVCPWSWTWRGIPYEASARAEERFSAPGWPMRCTKEGQGRPLWNRRALLPRLAAAAAWKWQQYRTTSVCTI